jgi:hypothetical protein
VHLSGLTTSEVAGPVRLSNVPPTPFEHVARSLPAKNPNETASAAKGPLTSAASNAAALLKKPPKLRRGVDVG